MMRGDGDGDDGDGDDGKIKMQRFVSLLFKVSDLRIMIQNGRRHNLDTMAF